MSVSGDEDAAMAQLMGFSSFGNKKARHDHDHPREQRVSQDREPAANGTQMDSHQASAGQQESDSTFFTTTSAPNQLDHTDVQPMTTSQTPRARQPQNADEIAYTNPQTGISFTRRQLDEYAKGKEEVLADGSRKKVFFRPSFVEEGLWERWEGKGDAQVKARERLEAERGERVGSMLGPATTAIGGL